MKNYYHTKPNTKLLSIFKKADTLNQKINAIKEHNSNLWQTILTKLKIEWTYNSNSIEGSTLSRGDTHFFLTEGLTVEGKPFKDFLDAKNHLEAIDYLYDIVANRRDVSEGLIKELNALIQANIHQYVEPIQVQPQMQELIEWIEQVRQTHHPILVSSIVHYNLVRIHAFDDGNGRGARILMNLILMKNNFFPAVIRTQKKRKYLTILHQADKGDIVPFIEFMAMELIETMEGVLVDLNT